MLKIIWRSGRRLLLPVLVGASLAALAVPPDASAIPTTTTGDIVGVVTAAGTSINGLTVLAFPAGTNPIDESYGNSSASAETSTDGSTTGQYDLSGLAPGSYTVLALPTANDGDVPTYSNGATAYAQATALTVVANATTTTNTNIALVTGATISGTVSGASGGGVGDLEVDLNDAGGYTAYGYYGNGGGVVTRELETLTSSGASVGSYSFTGLAAGTFYVDFQDAGASDSYANEWFGGTPTISGATPVTVADGDSFNASQVLSAAAQITGTLDDGINGGPLTAVSAYVEAENSQGDEVASAEVDAANGTYTVIGLMPGTYWLYADPENIGTTTDYASGYYDGAASLAQSEPTGQSITVAAGQSVTASTASVPSGGTLSGTVSDGGVPAADVSVILYDSQGNQVTFEGTASDGTYSFGGNGYYLDPGAYKVGFVPNGSLAFQYYDNATSLAAASVVTVPGGGADLPNINAALGIGGEMTGTVTDASTGAPLAGVEVDLEDAKGDYLDGTTTGNDGTYTVAGIPTGTYYVEFDPTDALYPTVYQIQYYGAKQVLAGSTSVGVTAGQTTSGVNAALGADTTAGQVTTTTQTTTTTVPAQVPTVVGTPPVVTGTVKVGKSLATVESGWTPGTAYTYQWYAAGKAIDGATNATLALAAADYKKTITVMVTGKLSGYNFVTETSALTKAVAAGSLTTVVPKISGTAKVADKLVAKTGTWTKGTKFSYQWYAGKKAIKHATKSTFTLASAERGRLITVKVTGKLTGYGTASRTSKATKKVAG